MNKTNTQPLLFYFLFLVGFSLLLVECGKLFPSAEVVPPVDQSAPTNIKNIILEVPVKPVSSAIGMTCENDINRGGKEQYAKNLFAQGAYLSAYNYDVFKASSTKF